MEDKQNIDNNIKRTEKQKTSILFVLVLSQWKRFT